MTKGRPIPVRPVKLHVPRRGPAHLGARADRGDPGGVRASAGPVPAVAAGRDRDAGRPGAGAAALRLRLPRAARCTSCPGPTTRTGHGRRLRSAAVVPVSTPLVRLYSEYMHVEYGEHRLGLRVREPVRRPGRRRDDLPGGAPADRPHRRPHRDRLHRPHAAPQPRHRHDPPGRADRGGRPAAHPPLLDDHRARPTSISTRPTSARRCAGPGCGTEEEPVTSPVPAGASGRGSGRRRRGGRPRRPVGLGPLGCRPPGHPRPARTRHGALRRDQPALAARPGQALVPVPPGHRVRVHHHRRRGAGAHPVLPVPRRVSPARRTTPSAITRPVLEDYLSWLVTQGYSAATRALSCR